MPLVWGCRRSGFPDARRVARSDLLDAMCARSRSGATTDITSMAEAQASSRSSSRASRSATGSVQNLSHFRLAERHSALAHAVMAPLICWSFSNSMFRYRLVDHAVPAMWRSLAAARLSAD